jgi:hypothetical protein
MKALMVFYPLVILRKTLKVTAKVTVGNCGEDSLAANAQMNVVRPLGPPSSL